MIPSEYKPIKIIQRFTCFGQVHIKVLGSIAYLSQDDLENPNNIPDGYLVVQLDSHQKTMPWFVDSRHQIYLCIIDWMTGGYTSKSPADVRREIAPKFDLRTAYHWGPYYEPIALSNRGSVTIRDDCASDIIQAVKTM